MASSSDEKATFTLSLETANAEKVAAELESLKSKIFEDINQLNKLNQAMKALKASGTATKESIAALKAQINQQKLAVTSSKEAFANLQWALRAINSTAGDGSGEMGRFGKALEFAKTAGGPIGSLASRLSNLVSWLGKGSTAAGALTLASIALAGALAVAAGALTKFGISAAEAFRNETLALEGASKLRVGMFFLGDGMIRARDSGKFVQEQIDSITSSFDISREAAIGYASSLQNMGMRSGNLQAALEGVALAAQTQGEAGVAQFKAMIWQAAMFGGSVKRVTDDFKARLGPIAQRQMIGIGAQMRMLQKNVQLLFRDLKIEGLLTGLKSVTELFGQSTASGQALKKLIEVVFQPIIDFLANQAPLARAFFEGLQIGALLLAIAIYKVRNYLRDTFGGWLPESIDGTTAALWLGQAAVFALAGAMTYLAYTALAAVLPIIAIPALIIAGGLAIAYIIDQLDEFGESLSYLGGKAWEWASEIINGMVEGITRGAGRVIDAIKTLANKAKTAFKDVLDINSPSREFMKLGLHIPEGQAEGIRKGTPEVEQAITEMTPMGAPGGTGAPAPNSGGRGNVTVNFGDLHFPQGMPTDEQTVKRWLTEAVVGAVMQMGIA